MALPTYSLNTGLALAWGLATGARLLFDGEDSLSADAAFTDCVLELLTIEDALAANHILELAVAQLGAEGRPEVGRWLVAEIESETEVQALTGPNETDYEAHLFAVPVQAPAERVPRLMTPIPAERWRELEQIIEAAELVSGVAQAVFLPRLVTQPAIDVLGFHDVLHLTQSFGRQVLEERRTALRLDSAWPIFQGADFVGSREGIRVAYLLGVAVVREDEAESLLWGDLASRAQIHAERKSAAWTQTSVRGHLGDAAWTEPATQLLARWLGSEPADYRILTPLRFHAARWEGLRLARHQRMRAAILRAKRLCEEADVQGDLRFTERVLSDAYGGLAGWQYLLELPGIAPVLLDWPLIGQENPVRSANKALGLMAALEVLPLQLYAWQRAAPGRVLIH